jgi:hypothetical protein
LSQSAARNSQTSAGVGNLPRSRIAGRQSPGNPQGLQHSGVLRVETGLRPGGYGPAGQPSPRGYGAARNSRSGGSIEGSSPHPVPFHEPGNIERRTSNEKEPSPHPDPLPSHQNGSGEGIASGRRGSVLNSGARLYEPQHIPMQSKPLRVADPRSENKSGHYRRRALLDRLAAYGRFRGSMRELLRGILSPLGGERGLVRVPSCARGGGATQKNVDRPSEAAMLPLKSPAG